jgi:hypothetical protein
VTLDQELIFGRSLVFHHLDGTDKLVFLHWACYPAWWVLQKLEQNGECWKSPATIENNLKSFTSGARNELAQNIARLTNA